MPVRKLTASFVKGAGTEPGAERTIWWDKDLPGFGLMVTPTGHKSYVVQYRAHRTSRRFTINSVLSLDEARKEAKAVLGKVAKGGDPVLEHRRAAESDRHSLRAVCEKYLAREGRNLRSVAYRRSVLDRLVFPKLGAWRVDEIKRSDLNHLLDEVEDKNGPAMADHVLAFLRRIFNWQAIRDDNFRSPIVRGMARRKADERERERVLTDDELRRVWTIAESYPAAPWGHAVRLLLLTAARRTEIAEMTWNELDLERSTWTIPAQRYKTNKEVTLPLSSAAKKVLAQIPRIEGCDYVLTTDGKHPVSGFSTFKLRFDIACGVKDWRLHDLRRTSRSLLSRAGVNVDVAERCLGHAIGGVRGVYDRHRYLEEMRHAFEALATQIDRIVHPVENVVALHKNSTG
jgi:integrase